MRRKLIVALLTLVLVGLLVSLIALRRSGRSESVQVAASAADPSAPLSQTDIVTPPAPSSTAVPSTLPEITRDDVIATVQSDPRVKPGSTLDAKLMPWSLIRDASNRRLQSPILSDQSPVWVVEVNGGYDMGDAGDLNWLLIVFDARDRHVMAETGSAKHPAPAYFDSLPDQAA
jgi:hypothetical protein